MSGDGPVAEFLRHLDVERQGSAHTLDAYRRDLAALHAWADRQGQDLVALDSHALRAFVAVTVRPVPSQSAAPAFFGRRAGGKRGWRRAARMLWHG